MDIGNDESFSAISINLLLFAITARCRHRRPRTLSLYHRRILDSLSIIKRFAISPYGRRLMQHPPSRILCQYVPSLNVGFPALLFRGCVRAQRRLRGTITTATTTPTTPTTTTTTTTTGTITATTTATTTTTDDNDRQRRLRLRQRQLRRRRQRQQRGFDEHYDVSTSPRQSNVMVYDCDFGVGLVSNNDKTSLRESNATV